MADRSAIVTLYHQLPPGVTSVERHSVPFFSARSAELLFVATPIFNREYALVVRQRLVLGLANGRGSAILQWESLSQPGFREQPVHAL